jgi:predicted DNA-binding protein
MKRTTIMADEELLYKIGRIAQRKGVSKATIIREALVEYVAEEEEDEPLENPLFRLVGLAGDDAIETDFSDGKDEEYILDNIHPRFGFTVVDDEEISN